MNEVSLQERFAPENLCFGCGLKNEKGLRLRSFPISGEGIPDGTVECTFIPEAHHEAFPGVLNGGIIGALLDCHMNWAAIWHLVQRDGLSTAPPTVTAEYSVTLRRPTPTDGPMTVRAHAVSSDGARVVVESALLAQGKVCATGRGTFVAVEPGHPAWHRW